MEPSSFRRTLPATRILSPITKKVGSEFLVRCFGDTILPVAVLCFGPLLTAASTACSNRSHAPGSGSISSGFGFLGGFAMSKAPKSPVIQTEHATAIGYVASFWSIVEANQEYIIHSLLRVPSLTGYAITAEQKAIFCRIPNAF